MLVLKLSQIWPAEVPSCVLVTCTHHVLSPFFFFFWHYKMFQAHIMPTLSQPQIEPFLQGALVSFKREYHRP